MSRTGSADMDGLKRKNSQGTQNLRKAKEHSQLQAKRAYPTAGERTRATQQQGKELELLVIKHSAIEKIPDEEWELLKAVQRQ